MNAMKNTISHKTPYPPATKVKTLPPDVIMTGIVVDFSITRTGFRYLVLVDTDSWNASGRRFTERPVLLNLYDDEIEEV